MGSPRIFGHPSSPFAELLIQVFKLKEIRLTSDQIFMKCFVSLTDEQKANLNASCANLC